MWETFDWKMESREGAEQEERGQGVLPIINHSSSALKRAFQPGEGSGSPNPSPRANSLILGLIPERGNTFQTFIAKWPQRDTVTWG